MIIDSVKIAKESFMLFVSLLDSESHHIKQMVTKIQPKKVSVRVRESTIVDH
jgi:hypothetical protein